MVTPDDASAAQPTQEPPPIEFAEALTQFTPEEHERLRLFLEHVERLVTASYWKRPPNFTLKFKRGEGWQTEAPWEENDEAVEAMMSRLRVVYAPGNRPTAASFPRTRTMLSRHVAPTPEAARLTTELREYKRSINRILSAAAPFELALVTEDADGNVVERRVVTPKEALEDWLYADVLHDDDVRRERLRPWREWNIHKNVAMNTAWNLTYLYHHFAARIVRPILAEPALFATPSA